MNSPIGFVSFTAIGVLIVAKLIYPVGEIPRESIF